MFNFIPQRIDSLSLYPIVFFQNKQDLSFQKHLPVYQNKLKLEDMILSQTTSNNKFELDTFS